MNDLDGNKMYDNNNRITDAEEDATFGCCILKSTYKRGSLKNYASPMKHIQFKLTIPLIAILASLALTCATAADTDSAFAWPPKLEDYSPSTPGWKNIYDRRFKQLATASSDDVNERYSVYVVRKKK